MTRLCLCHVAPHTQHFFSCALHSEWHDVLSAGCYRQERWYIYCKSLCWNVDQVIEHPNPQRSHPIMQRTPKGCANVCVPDTTEIPTLIPQLHKLCSISHATCYSGAHGCGSRLETHIWCVSSCLRAILRTPRSLFYSPHSPTLYQMTVTYETVTLSDNRKLCSRVCGWLVTDLLKTATPSISAWSKQMLTSEGETNATCTVCLYWLVVQLIFNGLCCVKIFNKHDWSRSLRFYHDLQQDAFGLKRFFFIDILQSFSCFRLLSSLSLLRWIFYWYPSFRTLFPLLLKSGGVLYVMKTVFSLQLVFGLNKSYALKKKRERDQRGQRNTPALSASSETSYFENLQWTSFKLFM